MNNHYSAVFKSSDDMFLALGPWKPCLPVYKMIDKNEGVSLIPTKMSFPACCNFMPAEGVWGPKRRPLKTIRRDFKIKSPLPPPSRYKYALMKELMDFWQPEQSVRMSAKKLLKKMRDEGLLDDFYKRNPPYDPQSSMYFLGLSPKKKVMDKSYSTF